MYIQNFEQLAITPARRQLLTIAEAGYRAAGAYHATRRAVIYDEQRNRLVVQSHAYDLSKYKRIICVGFGKAALESARAVFDILGSRIACGFVIDVRGGKVGNLTCRIGNHPHPTVVNIAATKEVLAMLQNPNEDDLIIMLISGGGSSLLCMPHDITCDTETKIISALTRQGATIQEINTVRKHVSKVKGGQLAAWCYPATVISLIISDIPGNDLSMVASGPTVKDVTTMHNAREILEKYRVLEICEMPSCSLIETPKEQKYFGRVHNYLIASPTDTLAALKNKAEELGVSTLAIPEHFQGEARQVVQKIIRQAAGVQCVVAVGESTVRVTGSGSGGRNQEMALAALTQMPESAVFGSFATDGHDNTEAAGAIADSQTIAAAHKLNLDIQTFLNTNDSFTFFKATGDAVHTGPTGTNVADFAIYLIY